ncbi:MAG: hypothetical protein JWO13_3816 [Acidobacteriales bacterium]|nr:hypothetical protein [Terriglobales bacterium]
MLCCPQQPVLHPLTGHSPRHGGQAGERQKGGNHQDDPSIHVQEPPHRTVLARRRLDGSISPSHDGDVVLSCHASWCSRLILVGEERGVDSVCARDQTPLSPSALFDVQG